MPVTRKTIADALSGDRRLGDKATHDPEDVVNRVDHRKAPRNLGVG